MSQTEVAFPGPGPHPSARSSPADFRYRVFLSYSHADTKQARWLMRRIEGYRVPRQLHGRAAPVGPVGGRIAPVFRDRDELPTTSDLGQSIRAALRESATLVVVCSPAAARSRWVQEEILTFKRLGGEARIFAFIVAGEPKSAGGPDDCFPPALRLEMGADGVLTGHPAEVVAADARPQGDGPKLAIVRLLAGLLGVGFDDLRQRELLRRQRRAVIVASLSAVGMSVTLGLAALAWRASNDAQRRQDDTEDLLSFILGDLRGQLQRVGRLDVLESATQRSLAYFTALNPRDQTDLKLARHARALIQIGEIRMDQARYDEASAAFAAAHARADLLAARHRENPEMLFERGQAEYWNGFVQWRRGDLARATEWLTRYRDTGVALQALNPGSNVARGELAWGHHNLAILDIDRSRLDAAREGLEAELRILHALRTDAPGDNGLEFRIADATSWLGKVAERAGHFGDARRHYADEQRRLETLVQRDPKTARWKIRLADALAREADILAITGERAASLDRRRAARALIDPLATADPANRTWSSAANNLRLKDALVLHAEGDADRARPLLAEALSTYEKLVQAEPGDRLRTAQLVIAWRLEAELRLDAGSADADKAAARAITLGKGLVENDRANENLLGDYIAALVVAGRIAAAKGDVAQARSHWQQALESAGPRLAGSNWRLLDPAARALALHGDHAASADCIARLTAAGYKPLRTWPAPTAP